MGQHSGFVASVKAVAMVLWTYREASRSQGALVAGEAVVTAGEVEGQGIFQWVANERDTAVTELDQVVCCQFTPGYIIDTNAGQVTRTRIDQHHRHARFAEGTNLFRSWHQGDDEQPIRPIVARHLPQTLIAPRYGLNIEDNEMVTLGRQGRFNTT